MTRWGAASWKAAGLAVAFGLVLAGIGSATAGSSLKSYTDDALAEGFMATVFGLEHGSSGAGIVKKWHRPVRFRIDNESASDRSRTIAKFIGQLSSRLPGIDARLARPGEEANFVVHVVDRSGYAERVRTVAYGGTHGRVPGRCMVKVDFGRRGIDRSDAFIVADEGDGLFQRCMIEEILQGLGPMNDSSALRDSVFNDSSHHTRLMAFDRAVVAMLYDSRVRHGMSRSEVEAIMPELVAKARKSVR